jgi:hypothetical protein
MQTELDSGRPVLAHCKKHWQMRQYWSIQPLSHGTALSHRGSATFDGVCAVCVRFVQPCSLESVKDGPCVLLNVGWRLVGWLCLTARSLPRCDPRKAANQAAFETVQRGTEWGCLSVPVCASLSLSRGRGAESAAMLRNSGGFVGIAEDDSHCVCYVLV